MNPANDPLYRVRPCPAARDSRLALACPQWSREVPADCAMDPSGSRLPPPGGSVRIKVKREPKFQLGKVCITANAANAVPPNEVLQAVARHGVGDWGSLDDHDWQENERALSTRGRLMSVYQAADGTAFWVITDAGWEITTVLLPEDY